VCEGGFAVFAHAAFAFGKRRIQKFFLRGGIRKNREMYGSARLPAQAVGRECGRLPEYFRESERRKEKFLWRKEVWK
jgi:hypothetical protein